ncbi:MAG: response regulator [Arthrospira sp. PLM2.Bin9]|nr:response regulator [Arthrospira sp. PLM2.Bin9]TVU52844.1 MAG: response regulator [Arthrospira sp. PLM2.Bin9]
MDNERLAKILIVDDTPTNIKVLFKLLKEAGFKVLVANSGEIALSSLDKVTPDLILLDVQMPGIDGFETCRRLKENSATQEIPVIFMTAISDVEHKVKGLELGAVDYITKPFQHQEVLARVKVHLQMRQLQKNLKDKNLELEKLNQTLENRVEERTAHLQKTVHQLQEMQDQLVNHEKMSALGQLMAGVAHEINNPINFIVGNLKYAEEYIQDLVDLLALYQQKFPEGDADINDKIEEIDLDYLLTDLPQLIASMKEGTCRISQISTSLRIFARSDTDAKIDFDIHDGINSTLLILKHRFKANQNRPGIRVIKNYGQLPKIQCYPGQLNQVFMNVISNAIDALEEASQGQPRLELEANPNQITIATKFEPCRQVAIISIHDNGPGMSPEIQAKIFDRLFTTKSVGVGTGLGLSLSRQIVEEKHNGKILCKSEPGQGAEFIIEIPVN